MNFACFEGYGLDFTAYFYSKLAKKFSKISYPVIIKKGS